MEQILHSRLSEEDFQAIFDAHIVGEGDEPVFRAIAINGERIVYEQPLERLSLRWPLRVRRKRESSEEPSRG